MYVCTGGVWLFKKGWWYGNEWLGRGWSLMVLRWIQNWVSQLQTTVQLIRMSLMCIVQRKPWLASHISQFSLISHSLLKLTIECSVQMKQHTWLYRLISIVAQVQRNCTTKVFKVKDGFSCHRLVQILHLHSWWSSPATGTSGGFSMPTSSFTDVRTQTHMGGH